MASSGFPSPTTIRQAAQLLLAADRLRALDPKLSRETYLEAVTAAIFAGPLAGPGASSPEVARGCVGFLYRVETPLSMASAIWNTRHLLGGVIATSSLSVAFRIF